MTVYTCNLLYKHDATGEYRPRLWADDDLELFAAAEAIGATAMDIQPNADWFNYLITELQQALAIADGAVMTDYLGPRYWRAQREGDAAMIRSIELSRAAVANAPPSVRFGRLSRRDMELGQCG